MFADSVDSIALDVLLINNILLYKDHVPDVKGIICNDAMFSF